MKSFPPQVIIIAHTNTRTHEATTTTTTTHQPNESDMKCDGDYDK